MAGKIVSFDIGEKYLKMVSFSNRKLLKTAAVELPDHLVEGGEILSMDAMGDFIRMAARENGMPKGDAVIVLPASLLITRRTTLPMMTESQLQYNLPYDFRDFLTEDKSQYYFDYAVLGTTEPTENEPGSLRLFAAAVLKSTVERYREMFSRAGFKLKTALPEEWAYAILADRSLEPIPGKPRCFVDLGYAATRMYFVGDGSPQTSRTIHLGFAQLEADIAERAGIDRHLAHSYLTINYNHVLTNEIAMEHYSRIGVEALKVVNFYRYNNPDAEIAQLVFCGGGAGVPALCATVAETVGLVSKRLEEAFPQQPDAFLFAKAIGCALQ